MIFIRLSNFKYNGLKCALLPHSTQVSESDKKTNAYDLLCRANPYVLKTKALYILLIIHYTYVYKVI